MRDECWKLIITPKVQHILQKNHKDGTGHNKRPQNSVEKITVKSYIKSKLLAGNVTSKFRTLLLTLYRAEIQLFTLAHPGRTYSPKRQSAQMSEIKNVG